MEEINLTDLFKYFLKHIKLILVALAVVLLGGEFYSLFLKVPIYQSSTTVAFSSEQQVTSTDVTTAKSLTGLYNDLVKSELVIGDAEHSTAYSYDEIARAISVSTSTDSGTIKITASYTDPTGAQVIAESVTDSFMEAAKELVKNDNRKVINYAHVAEAPSNINIVKDTIIYLLVGTALGFGIVFVMFYFDKKIHSNEEIERKLNIPVLGNIRTATRAKNGTKAELTIKHAPQSGVSEDIRTLRANIEFGFNPKDDHIVLITSANKSEGKSFISANLAYALATNGKKTLLIDCDLRRGRLHHIFKIDNLNGMSDLILNKDIRNIDKYICPIEEKRLHVIPRGIIPLNPSELLSSRNFKDIITYLNNYYDYIILDGAPILNLSDSLAISKIAAKTVLVASANYTTFDDLEGSTRSLEQVEAKLAGVILNKVQVSENKYYYHE